MRHAPALIAIVAASSAVPAHARERIVDIPPGTAAQSAIALARQIDASIVVTGSSLSNRRIPRIRGRMSREAAVLRLAEAADAHAIRIGSASWRLEPRPARRAAPRTAARPPQPRPAPSRMQPAPTRSPPIIVTATKRDLQFLNTPVQVSLLDGEELTMGGTGGTEEITQRVATVSSTSLGSGRNKLFIRGIADSSFTGPTQATVGQYFGDIRLSYNAPDPDLRLSDLDRVEVLEGPQGTLYGAGSLGGIIRLVPNAPQFGIASGTLAMGAAVTAHGAGSGDFALVANLPVIDDRTALRVTLDAISEGGYIDKPFLNRENVNRTSILSGRAMMRREIAEDWSVDVIGIGQFTDVADSQYSMRNRPGYDSAARVEEGSNAEYLHTQTVVEGTLGATRLRSSTAIATQNLEERYDATMPGEPDRLFVQSNDTRMIAHETRLWHQAENGTGWLAGFSVTDNETTLRRALQQRAFRNATAGVTNAVTEGTVYGEKSFALLDRLIGTVGARYTIARLAGGAEDISPELALTAERAQITVSRNQSAFLPSASLLAKLTPKDSAYIRYQEGFRPGGLSIENEFVRRFRRDDTATVEIGARHGEPGRGPFDFGINLSYTRWSDIQADFIDASGLPSTANIGDGRVWSASGSGSVRLGEGLRMNGGATVNRSRIDEAYFLPASATRHVPNIAAFSGRLGLEFSRSIATRLDLDARLWGSYVGKSRLGIGPDLGDLQGDYFDSGLIVRVRSDDIAGTLSITNLTDTQGNRFAFGTPFAVIRAQETPLRPRTLRLGVNFAF
ncbi:TonB-dependent receptor [Croceicoccus hydrothermalis]|uniref:TonB-dependent receptor n=1 Tax=Croceicoccus hydrothermalis TaxID=2867964 RepID=UPI001EFBEAEF|nr:TonB-dependent receptor [Croceicoccus hydrothermalis]